jgi:hypothetical protein
MKKIVNADTVRQLGMLQCTQKEAAAFFDITLSTFRRLLRQEPAVRKAWDQGLEGGKISLRRKQMRLANSNPAMAIFLGKQYLGQQDVNRNEVTGKGGEPVAFRGKIQVEFIKSKTDD